MATKRAYFSTSVTGGGEGALDSIDGNSLNDLDVSLAVNATTAYIYTLDDDSGAGESSPDIISPDSNAGTKRWLLANLDTPTLLTDKVKARSASGLSLVEDGDSLGIFIQDSTGYVGINEATPEAVLHVTATDEHPDIIFEETYAGRAISVYWRNPTREWSVFADGSPDEFAIGNATGGDTVLRILGSNNNVGIGSPAPTNPDSPLHIEGVGQLLHLESTGSAGLRIEADTDNVTETDHAYISMSQDNGLLDAYIGYRDGQNHLKIDADSSGGSDGVLWLMTENTSALQIDSSQNVSIVNGNLSVTGTNNYLGVGYASPTAPLHVRNASIAPDVIFEETAAGSSIQVEWKNPTRRWWIQADASPDLMTIQDVTGGNNKIQLVGGDGHVHLSPDSGGYTAVGLPYTTTPSYQLHVEGSTDPVIQISSTYSATAWIHPINAINAVAGASDHVAINVGQANTARNVAWFGFYYTSSGSVNNLLTMGMHSVDDALTISGNAHVGIGTGTTPASTRLHVYNNAASCVTTIESDSYSAGLVLDCGTASDVAYMDFKHGGVLKGNIGCNTATTGQPLELNSAVSNDVSLVIGGGAVGINTTTPSELLEVYKSQNTYTRIQATNPNTGSSAQAGCSVKSNAATGGIAAYGSAFSIISGWADKVSLYADTDATALIVGALAGSGYIQFYTGGYSSSDERMRLLANGNLGIGEIAAETLVEMTSTAPYLTLHNSTHEDTDGGRESRIIFKGEQSGGEETVLAIIEAKHDGSSDDQQGWLEFKVNDGDDGSSPSHVMGLEYNGVFYVGDYDNGDVYCNVRGKDQIAGGNDLRCTWGIYAGAAGGGAAGFLQGAHVGASTNHGVALRANNVDELVVLPGGYVGIGRIDPSVKLDIDADSTDDYIRIARFLNSSQQTGENITLAFGREDAAGNCGIINFNYAGDASASNSARFGIASGAAQFYVTNNNTFGFNEEAPSSLIEITDTAPYITLHNSTHEDSDGGRESRIIFRGENSTGTEGDMAYIEGSHYGTGSTAAGRLHLHTHDGSSMQEILRVDQYGVYMWQVGDGYALRNNSGSTVYGLSIGVATTQGGSDHLKLSNTGAGGDLSFCLSNAGGTANEVEIIRLNAATENVGIKESSPNTTLDIGGATSADAADEFGIVTDGGQMIMGGLASGNRKWFGSRDATGQLDILTTGALDILFWTNSTERLRLHSGGGIETTGALGINTTPGSNLQLEIGACTTDQAADEVGVQTDGGEIVIGGEATGSRTWIANRDTAGTLEFITVNASPLKFWTNATERMTILSTGYVGFNEVSPETIVEVTSTVPYLTLHNSTHEDSDGGRESRLIFKGEQSGGEETTLAWLQVSHDGTSDDEKGKIEFYVNDGNDGTSPTLALTIDSNGTLISTGAKQDGTVRITSVDSPYSVTSTDHIIYANTDGGDIEIDLTAGIEGRNLKIIDCGSSGNDLTIDPDGTEQIYGGGAGVAFNMVDAEVINIHFNSTEGWW